MFKFAWGPFIITWHWIFSRYWIFREHHDVCIYHTKHSDAHTKHSDARKRNMKLTLLTSVTWFMICTLSGEEIMMETMVIIRIYKKLKDYVYTMMLKEVILKSIWFSDDICHWCVACSKISIHKNCISK